MQDLAGVTQRFHEIAQRVLTASEVEADPWFHQYLGATMSLAGAAKYVRQQSDFLRYGWPSEHAPVVLDAGSGFGFSLVVAALLGARSAVGIELNPSMVATMNAYLPLLPEDVRSKIEVTVGSVHDMPYDDESADIVLSLEAISHYLDVDRFLDEALRVLVPGGVLVVSDGNNGANPAVRKHTYEIWAAAEQGSAGGAVHGHTLGTPYCEVRRVILGRELPELSPEKQGELARRTAGFTEEQLLASARDVLAGGPMPDSAYRHGQLAVAPDGTVMERLFVPGELAERMRGRGFEAKAYGYWGGAGGRSWVRLANRALSTFSPLTVFTARSFRVIARKPARKPAGTATGTAGAAATSPRADAPSAER